MSLWDSFRLRKISSTPSGSLEKSQASHPAPQNLDSSKTEMIARRKSIDFCCHKLSNFKVLQFAWSCYEVRTSISLLWRAKRSAQTILVTKTLAFLPVPVSRSDPRLERKSIAKVINLLYPACALTLICCDVAYSTQEQNKYAYLRL
jgi:hypothetical protein